MIFSCFVFLTCGFSDTGITERDAGFNIRTGQIKTVSDLKAIKNVAIAEINEFTLAAADSSDVREALDDGTTLVVNNISDEGVKKLSEATEEDFTSYDVPSYRLAGIDVSLVGLKLKTVGTTTYNAFAADFIVGGDSSSSR